MPGSQRWQCAPTIGPRVHSRHAGSSVVQVWFAMAAASVIAALGFGVQSRCSSGHATPPLATV
jgi:hypothetical protein